MGKSILHSRNFRIAMIFLISSIFLVGIIVPFINANFSRELYFRIDGKGMNRGDKKLILFVDVPDTGGKALAYTSFEIRSKGLRDIWDFFDINSDKVQKLKVDLFTMDFVFIIASDSNGNGERDQFSLKLNVPNSPYYENYLGYNFGSKYGNNLIIGVWLLDHIADSISIFNSGLTVFDIWDDGSNSGGYSPYYDYDDWSDLWSYLENYVSAGDESIVTNLINNFDFPYPATILYN
ncbi:MAG: hypothetical protein FK733_04520 [Asgard group archaeon]|nr:hypothetical protein [Asgard group archaeon]